MSTKSKGRKKRRVQSESMMENVATSAPKERGSGREGGAPMRRCAQTRAEGPRSSMLRLVLGPDGLPFVDILGRAPGRGVYLKPDRALLEESVSARGLGKMFRGRARPLSDEARATLVEDTIRRIEDRIVELVSLARRAGLVEIGMDAVRRLLEQPEREGVTVVMAKDVSPRTEEQVEALAELSAGRSRDADRAGAGDPSGASRGRADSQGADVVLIRCATKFELGGRLGRQDVGVVGIASSVLSERIRLEGERLAGLSCTSTNPAPRGRVRRRERADERAAPGARRERGDEPEAVTRLNEEHD